MSGPAAAGGPVLLTGAGFVGRAILDALKSRGCGVRTLQRRPADHGAASICGDIRDPAIVAQAVEGCRAVIHAAGLAHVFDNPENAPFADINETGTDVVARAAAAAGVERFILVSSVSVYGSARAGGRESLAAAPDGPYAISKAAAETRAIAAASASRMRLTVLRLATVYGEGDRGNVHRLLEAIARRRFVWIGDGRNRKSLLHVADAGRACAMALDDIAGQKVDTFNVSAPAVPMADVVRALARELSRPVPRVRIPAGVATAAAAALAVVSPARGRRLQTTVAKWLRDDVYPGDLFEKQFRFSPAVSLEEGIARQVAAWRRSAG